jgi:uroporphyrin-3 C-methyltransferase
MRPSSNPCARGGAGENPYNARYATVPTPPLPHDELAMATTPDPESTPADQAEKRASRRKRAPAKTPARSGRFAAGLSLVLAIIALLVSGYVGYLVNSKRGLSDAKGRLFQVEKETAQLQELSKQMGSDLATLRETQLTLQGGLQSLNSEIGKGRRAWLLAETENLLTIAQHRLQYARDAHLALEALRAADHQLGQLGDPDYQPVRKRLEGEIGTLESFERLDLGAMARHLGELAAGVDQLPHAPERRPAPAATTGEQGFLREVWQDLQGLVRIRNTNDIRRALLLPEQKYFLRENLRLMLYGAQVALLHGDARTFEQNTKTAGQWLRDYYDTSDESVKSDIAALDATLKAHQMDMPDISMSLKALREIRSKQGGT